MAFLFSFWANTWSPSEIFVKLTVVTSPSLRFGFDSRAISCKRYSTSYLGKRIEKWLAIYDFVEISFTEFLSWSFRNSKILLSANWTFWTTSPELPTKQSIIKSKTEAMIHLNFFYLSHRSQPFYQSGKYWRQKVLAGKFWSRIESFSDIKEAFSTKIINWKGPAQAKICPRALGWAVLP